MQRIQPTTKVMIHPPDPTIDIRVEKIDWQFLHPRCRTDHGGLSPASISTPRRVDVTGAPSRDLVRPGAFGIEEHRNRCIPIPLPELPVWSAREDSPVMDVVHVSHPTYAVPAIEALHPWRFWEVWVHNASNGSHGRVATLGRQSPHASGTPHSPNSSIEGNTADSSNASLAPDARMTFIAPDSSHGSEAHHAR